MVRLDDDELNIDPAVAASLRYTPTRRRRRPAAAPAPAAPRRPGRGVGDAVGWIVTGLLGLFGTFILFTVICFAIAIGSGPAIPTTAAGMGARPQIAGSAPSTPPVPQDPIPSPSAEQISVASEPAPQQEASPAVETTSLEVDSRQTLQPPPQSESAPNGIGAPAASDHSAGPEEPEVMVEDAIREEPAVIPRSPEPGRREGRARAPETERPAMEGASSPFFSNWRWVCASRNGLRCGLQDVNGTYVQSFSWTGGPIQASGISREALSPRGLAWRCARMPGLLYCTISDSRGANRQGCAFDGRSLACGN